jgi:hypothetical protein
MSYFEDSGEVYHFIGGIFTEVLADPDLGSQFKDVGVIMGLHFTDPKSHLVIDGVEGKVYTGDECDAGPKPNIEMYMTADVAHQYWLGKVNVPQALSKGQMRAKGPATTILKLVPITQHVFPRYARMIDESGREALKA